MTSLLIYAAASLALVLVFPRVSLAATAAGGLAAIGLWGMYQENIPPDPVGLAGGITLFAALFFGVLVGAIWLRNQLVKLLRRRT